MRIGCAGKRLGLGSQGHDMGKCTVTTLAAFSKKVKKFCITI